MVGLLFSIQSDTHAACPLRSRPELSFKVGTCGQQINNYAFVDLQLQCMTLRVFQGIPHRNLGFSSEAVQ